MNIAIDARFINSSTGRYIERLITYLEKVDQTNAYTILVLKKDKDYWRPTMKNFSVVVADYPPQSFSEQLGFLIFLYKGGFDLVHFCMFNQPLLYFKKHITTVHDLTILRTYNKDKNWLIFHIKQFVAQAVFFIVSRTSSHIITPSQFTKDDYLQFSGIKESRVTVTYEAADALPAPSEPYPLLIDTQFILYVGRQPDYKNIKNLISAHQLLLKNNPDLQLVLAGKIDKAAQTNIDWVRDNHFKNIIFTGFISDQTLAWLYQNCQTYVFPSFMEGFGLPGLEAMVEGAPVASSNASCLPEVYGDAAQYFDPSNPQDMARAIDLFLQSQTLRADFITRGKNHATSYSWRRMAEQTHTLYQKVMTKKS
ncbi:Glycogen synthase [compost metagenome]